MTEASAPSSGLNTVIGTTAQAVIRSVRERRRSRIIGTATGAGLIGSVTAMGKILADADVKPTGSELFWGGFTTVTIPSAIGVIAWRGMRKEEREAKEETEREFLERLGMGDNRGALDALVTGGQWVRAARFAYSQLDLCEPYSARSQSSPAREFTDQFVQVLCEPNRKELLQKLSDEPLPMEHAPDLIAEVYVAVALGATLDKKPYAARKFAGDVLVDLRSQGSHAAADLVRNALDVPQPLGRELSPMS